MKTNFIIEQIKQYATIQPEALFVDDCLNKQTGTYLELEEASNALAHYFIEKYPSKEPIMISGNLDKQSLIGFMACLKSGHPYIPVDDHTPTERLKMIYDEAKPCAVIATTNWPLPVSDIISDTNFNAIISTYPKDNVPQHNWVSQTDSVYIIFTSGTTGKPKGVNITYNNLMSFTQWMASDFSITPGLRFLCQAPFSFDLSVMDLYPALLSGGTLVPLRKDVTDNFPLLFATLPKLDLNVWVSTPSFIEICLMDKNFCKEQYPNLTHFLFCGEELPKKVAQKLLQNFPNSLVFNTYGPTETTVAITGVQITPNILEKYGRLPLGYVKKDTEIMILSEEDTADSSQLIGEILITGPSVSPGYYNNPEKTAEVFTHYNGAPAYHTGDAGYIMDDLLFYQGRLDFQIKWHGYRMELGDIDHHLEQISFIRRACVVPKYHQGKVKQLIAYLVLEDNSETDQKATTQLIKEELGQHVMNYMVPQKYIYLDELPLTANGKVNRKQLMQEVNPT